MWKPAATHRKLLHDGPFSSLLASKLATRFAAAALFYALLISVVQESDSPRYSTLFVLVYTLPAVAFGLGAGVAAERSSFRPILVAGHLSRAVVAGAIVVFEPNVWFLYLLLIGLATVGQFVGPAEASALPRLVKPEDRATAHSLVALISMVGTMLGAVTVGPILYKLAGWQAVLALSVALYGVAAAVAGGIRAPRPLPEASTTQATAATPLLHGWQALRTSPDALLAFGYLTIAAALGKVLVAFTPYYTRDVLGIDPENAVYVAVPAVIGALAALATTPLLVKMLGLRPTVNIGFFTLLVGLLAVAALVYIGDLVLTHLDLHIGYLEERVGPSSIISITILMAILVGFGGAMLSIVGETTINQEVEPASQARVSSTVSTVSAAVSLGPLVATAVVSDLVGVRAVLFFVGAGGLVGALLLRASRRNRARADLSPN